MTTGQIVTAKITTVADDGVLCTLPDGVSGIVTTDHMPGIYTKFFFSVWRSGNSVHDINEVKLLRAWLVLGLTTFGGPTIPIFI